MDPVALSRSFKSSTLHQNGHDGAASDTSFWRLKRTSYLCCRGPSGHETACQDAPELLRNSIPLGGVLPTRAVYLLLECNVRTLDVARPPGLQVNWPASRRSAPWKLPPLVRPPRLSQLKSFQNYRLLFASKRALLHKAAQHVALQGVGPGR